MQVEVKDDSRTQAISNLVTTVHIIKSYDINILVSTTTFIIMNREMK